MWMRPPAPFSALLSAPAMSCACCLHAARVLLAWARAVTAAAPCAPGDTRQHPACCKNWQTAGGTADTEMQPRQAATQQRGYCLRVSEGGLQKNCSLAMQYLTGKVRNEERPGVLMGENTTTHEKDTYRESCTECRRQRTAAVL